MTTIRTLTISGEPTLRSPALSIDHGRALALAHDLQAGPRMDGWNILHSPTLSATFLVSFLTHLSSLASIYGTSVVYWYLCRHVSLPFSLSLIWISLAILPSVPHYYISCVLVFSFRDYLHFCHADYHPLYYPLVTPSRCCSFVHVSM